MKKSIEKTKPLGTGVRGISRKQMLTKAAADQKWFNKHQAKVIELLDVYPVHTIMDTFDDLLTQYDTEFGIFVLATKKYPECAYSYLYIPAEDLFAKIQLQKEAKAKKFQEACEASRASREDHGRYCGYAAFHLGIPFEVCMAFKGQPYELLKFIKSIKAAWNKKADKSLLLNLHTCEAEMKKLGIYLGGTTGNLTIPRVNLFVYKCLQQKAIVKEVIEIK